MELESLTLYHVRMHTVKVASILAFSFLIYRSLAAQNTDQSQVLAEIQDTKILLDDVERAAAARLEQLEIERLRFEAQEVRKRHQLMKNTLDQMISEKLLEMEAETRNITKEQLLRNEVQEKVAPPSDDEVQEYYEKNKARFKGSKEEVLPHLQKYLERDKSNQIRGDFIKGLKEKYQVQMHFEPLRIPIESDGHPSLGPADAVVTIVEFSDFECPYCARLAETVDKATEQYEGKIKLVFRQFPLNAIHPKAQKAAEASLCAAEDGKFWEMHDLLFSDQKKLALADLKIKAESLGLQAEKFEECLDTGRYADSVKQDLLDGIRAGVTGTPAIFVNGRPFTGAVSYEALTEILAQELSRATQYALEQSSN